ncbi:DUF6503 family protein [Flagellimonas sediminis]|uniref:Uncharacterized protein n=1 Tax=Flagellimonas sediminis TaxID=2696468 RepID=A0A6I5KXE7_9FLAO|nr:DUF6503 family protein [Allomuricauda sediminis]NDV44469.1 hypothetical protein [Allomuricauda sediminis]
MKKTTILMIFLAFVACKPSSKKEQVEVPEPIEEVTNKTKYPENMAKVFEAHGGLELWKSMRTLSFVLPNPEAPETHTIDLWSRKDRVDTEKYSMGFDGEKAWLLDPDKSYKGDAAFYHNLMFYFYGMPFVLADEGIVYGHAEDLVFEGKHYPGVKISYNVGVGASSKDEYFIHFDPETYQMAWLGYTVTYRTGESSDNFRWIRYRDWQRLSGVLLPQTITWHNYEGRNILDARNTVTFDEASLSNKPKPDSFYGKPEGAEFVEIKKS